MLRIIKKEHCSGCSACVSACPINCIQMQQDEEGFLYPIIDENKCIQCDACKKTCPIMQEYRECAIGQAYAAINKNEKIRVQSSSGGIFSVLAEKVIDLEGVVFGAAFDIQWGVYHRAVKTKDELSQLRGSKYVQSRIGKAYQQAKEFLNDGKWVLFSGTPCQISGLRAYLQSDYDKLILVDMICHGVPSPKIWKHYIEHQSKVYKKRLNFSINPNFRTREVNWKQYSLVLPFSDGTKYQKSKNHDSYMKAFLCNLSLRPSCYQCRTKSLERESDITLADFWGIEKVLPNFSDTLGTSLVFVNSKKGNHLFEAIKSNIKWQHVNILEATKYNISAYQSAKMHPKREDFFRLVSFKNFDKIVKKYTRISIFKKMLIKIRCIFKK